ncbi:hypothetical protein [Kitasatospora griseola]|uniref:hypothetical protein n=1 Tax=Kitasatospora griseola TaxID=2064 RepID=UPI00364D60E0
MPESDQAWPLAQVDRPSTLSSRAWIDATPDGLVAFLLIAPSSTAIGSDDIAALATAIGLAGPQGTMPDVGERITPAAGAAILHIPEVGRAVRVPTSSEWTELVQRGGTVVILLSADPLPVGSAKSDTDSHLRAGLESNRLWIGKTACLACGECARCLSGTGRMPTPEAPDCVHSRLELRHG